MPYGPIFKENSTTIRKMVLSAQEILLCFRGTTPLKYAELVSFPDEVSYGGILPQLGFLFGCDISQASKEQRIREIEGADCGPQPSDDQLQIQLPLLEHRQEANSLLR